MQLISELVANTERSVSQDVNEEAKPRRIILPKGFTREGDYIVAPPGVRIITKHVPEDGIATKAKYICADLHARVFVEFHKPEQYKQLLDVVRDKSAEFLRELYKKYNKRRPGLWSKPKVKLLSVEPQQPILDYHPCSVRFDQKSVTVRDLFTGREYRCSRSPYVELDGEDSIQSPYKDGFPIARAIALASNRGEFSDRVPALEDIVFREVYFPNGKGQLWYFPFWEVPLTLTQEFEVKDEVMFKVRPTRQKGKHVWRHSVKFGSTAAMFFNGYTGDLEGVVLNDSYFNKENKSSTSFVYKAKLTPYSLEPDIEFQKSYREGLSELRWDIFGVNAILFLLGPFAFMLVVALPVGLSGLLSQDGFNWFFGVGMGASAVLPCYIYSRVKRKRYDRMFKEKWFKGALDYDPMSVVKQHYTLNL